MHNRFDLMWMLLIRVYRLRCNVIKFSLNRLRWYRLSHHQCAGPERFTTLHCCLGFHCFAAYLLSSGSVFDSIGVS